MVQESQTSRGSHGAPEHTVVVTVNNRNVTFETAEATGSAIKVAAIAQGVSIQRDFALFLVTGSVLRPVGDSESIHLHERQQFRAVAPDDNS